MKFLGRELTEGLGCEQHLNQEAYCELVRFHDASIPVVLCRDCWDDVKKNVRYVLKFEPCGQPSAEESVEELYGWDPLFRIWIRTGIYRWRA